MPVPSYFIVQLNKTTPWLCRVAATRIVHDRDGKRVVRFHVSELMAKSGLSKNMIKRVSAMQTWDGVKADVIGRFSAACNVNLLADNPLDHWLKFHYCEGLPWITMRQKKLVDRLAKKSGLLAT